MGKTEFFSLLFLALSLCANFIFFAIIIPTLDKANVGYGEDSKEMIQDLMVEIYRVNKPLILRKFFILDLYIAYGGVVYYLLFMLLSTIYVYEKSNIVSSGIYFVFLIFMYKVIGNIFRKVIGIVKNHTIFVSFAFLLSFILFLAIFYGLIFI